MAILETLFLIQPTAVRVCECFFTAGSRATLRSSSAIWIKVNVLPETNLNGGVRWMFVFWSKSICIPALHFFLSLVSVSVSDDGKVLPRLAQQIIVLLLCKFLSWFSTRSTAEVTDEAHISITYLAKLHSVLPVAFKDFSRMCCCELIHIVNKVAAVLSITQTFLYFLCSESETGFISK